MGHSRRYLVRFAALAALIWLGSAYAGGATQVLDSGPAAAQPPRVMTLEEEMADLRAAALRSSRTAAQEQASGENAVDPALTLVNLEVSQTVAPSEADEMIDLRRERSCLQQAASQVDADAQFVKQAAGNFACFARPQRAL